MVLVVVIVYTNYLFALGNITISFLKFSLILGHVTAMSTEKTFAGLDFGTSGARVSIVSSSLEELHTDSILWSESYPYDDPQAWIFALETLLESVEKSSLQAICVSGTSATCVLMDGRGRASRRARMYDYSVMSKGSEIDINGIKAMEWLERFAPPKHTTLAQTSSLAKLISWHMESKIQNHERLAHQADFVTHYLMCEDPRCGAGVNANMQTVTSDWHNCLKLGFDVKTLEWPSWLLDLLHSVNTSSHTLPQRVVSPGEVIGCISSSISKKFNLPPIVQVVGGTTDSNAAFMAATTGLGETRAGTAVTSLGSTLAIKLLSDAFIEDAIRGVYSHRFPDYSHGPPRWLVGGASNVGCAVLRQQGFGAEELKTLSAQIDPTKDSPLYYYPLTKRGERFPIADANQEPVLEPKPANRKEYLHGLLQGIARVECDGFKALTELGADHPKLVYSCGGGSQNGMWTIMRQRMLNQAFQLEQNTIQVAKAANTEASYGAAVLAASSFTQRV